MGLSHVIKIALDNRIDRYFIGLDALEDCFYGLFVCLFKLGNNISSVPTGGGGDA